MAVLEIPYRTGRLVVLADLHHDSYVPSRRDPFVVHGLDPNFWSDVDALIVAGDIANAPLMHWPRALAYLKQVIPPDRVFVLPGNHDFYGHFLDQEDDLRLIAEIASVNFVQTDELRIGATRIFTCTLWTDFELTGAPETAMSTAQRQMNDYSAVRKLAPNTGESSDLSAWRRYVPIAPHDTLALHREHRSWLEAQLATSHFAGPDGRTIVITHHGPHPATAGKIDGLTPAFHSNLEDLILGYAPDVWLFGHSHRRLRARVGSTDIRNVSIGYPNEIRLLEERPLKELCQIDIQDRWPK